MKIKEVKINNFRGIGNKGITIKLAESNLVLIYAPNGFGKTSIIDGVEWGLTGNISHLEEIKNIDKQRFKKCQMINFFSKDTGNSNSAEVELSFSNGEKLIRKNKTTEIGDFDRSSVEDIAVLDKLLTNKTDGIKFIDNFYHTHMLGQDTINSFLCNEKSGSRESKLLKIIGIESFDKINDAIVSNGVSLQTLKTKIKKYESDIEELKNKLNDEDERKCLIEGNFTSFQQVKEYVRLLEENISKNMEIIKEIDVNIFENLNNPKSSISKKYEKILGLPTFSETRLDKLNKDNEDINRILKNREKINILGEAYSNLRGFVSISYIQDNLSNLEQNLNNENRIKKLRTFITAISNYKSQFSNEKNIVNKHLSNLILINELEKLDFEDIKRLKEEILYINKELKFDIHTIKLLINNYVDQYEVLQNTTNNIKKLEKKIENLSKAKSDLKDFYRVNVKYIEGRIAEINGNNKCPLCNNEVTSQALLENLKNILDVNEDTYLELNSLKDDLLKEINIIEKELKIKKLEINDIVGGWIKSIKNNIEEKNVRIINVESKLKEKQKDALVKREIEKKNIQLFEDHLEKVNKFLTVNISKDEINEIKLEEYSIEIKEKLIYLHKKLRMLEILSEEYTLDKIINNPDYLYIAKGNLEDYEMCGDITDEELRSEIRVTNEKINNVKKFNIGLNDIMKKISIESVKRLEKYEIIKRGIEGLEIEYKELQNSLEIIETIKAKAEAYREEVIKEYILENKLVHQIYKNINPHPIHKEIKINNSDGLIFNLNDDNKRVQADYIFSSAQKNVLALSVFLGFALQQSWSNLEQIFIDDPIQNMDDINVIGFVDILRSLFNKESELKDKTIILTTHDEKFRNLVKMKFRNLKIREYRIESYDIDGPIIKESCNW